jgi:multidrug efflux pump subunit AcrA (membrane-fusion protein)
VSVRAQPWRWPLIFFIPIILVLGGLYALRVQQALAAPEVETVVVSVSRGGEGAAAGAPILTASGYVVARRKAVVSSKIQGRLAELRVEEGSRVRQLVYDGSVSPGTLYVLTSSGLFALRGM